MEDEKGNLHSEKDGKFVAKDNSEKNLAKPSKSTTASRRVTKNQRIKK